MSIRRIFAGAIVALLFSALPLGAACDLACSFARADSDCHSLLASTQKSARSDLKMDGMDMGAGGMSMPDMPNSDSTASVSRALNSRAAHSSIGDMGPCEQQSCGDHSASSIRSALANAKQIHSLLAAAGTPRVADAPAIFRGARDDVASHPPRNASAHTLSLRI